MQFEDSPISYWDSKFSTCFYVTEFSYIRGKHNVVVVDKHGYDTCEAPSSAYEQSSGFDHIYLKKGENYFICSKPGQCKLNMKMMINVE